MFTRLENGVEVDISVVEKNVDGVTEEASGVFKYKDGVEVEVWSASKAEFTSITGYENSTDYALTSTIGSDSEGAYYEIVIDNTASNGGLDYGIVLSITDLSGLGRTFDPSKTSMYVTVDWKQDGDDSIAGWGGVFRAIGLSGYYTDTAKGVPYAGLDGEFARAEWVAPKFSDQDSSTVGVMTGVKLTLQHCGFSVDGYIDYHTYRLRNVYLMDNDTGEIYPIGFNKSMEVSS